LRFEPQPEFDLGEKLKKIFVFLIICFSLSLFGKVILQLQDEVGDDYGDGNVIYPEHPMFTPGLFDIESFRIEENGDFYSFIIRIRGKVDYVDYAEFQYKYGIPEDFIFPLVQIYVDTDHVRDSGNLETLYGTNVTLSRESGWEKAVVISAMPGKFQKKIEHYHPVWSNRIFVPEKIHLSSDRKEIGVRISKSDFGEIKPSWGFAVLMFCHDVTSTTRKNIFVMEVKSSSSLFTFGGGHGALYNRYNPNVIDMIVPPFQVQKKILHNYDVENKTLAVIEAVYPFGSHVASNEITGEVRQISDQKVVINLGSEQGVQKGTKLIIDSRFLVQVEDVFPKLSIAKFTDEQAIYQVREGMQVRIWEE
jgi:carbohydrate-binding DOMON domain-containing protein